MHLSGSYHLFDGYNPILAGVRAYFNEPPTTDPLTTVHSRGHIEPESKHSCPVGIEQFIPRIDLANKEAIFFINRIYLQNWRQKAAQAENNGDYSTAMLFHKRICEVTVSEHWNWKPLLALAQNHFQEIVPVICKQILTYCYDTKFKQHVKTLSISEPKAIVISPDEETEQAASQSSNPIEQTSTHLFHYIPQIPMNPMIIKPLEENENGHRTEVNALKEAANAAKLRHDISSAMLHLKKICELTVHDADAWKAYLQFAKLHFRLLVPTICAQIMTHCINPSMQQEAKTLLTRSQLLAST